MTDYDETLCPICMVSELTAAMRVYPLCQCKLSICFDCLKRWAETKYCCPFCNIPFTQDALKQTEEQLKMRLQGQVAVDVLEIVVEAWLSLLAALRPELELGLAVLHMNSGLPENYSPMLTRLQVPFFFSRVFARSVSVVSGTLSRPILSSDTTGVVGQH